MISSRCQLNIWSTLLSRCYLDQVSGKNSLIFCFINWWIEKFLFRLSYMVAFCLSNRHYVQLGCVLILCCLSRIYVIREVSWLTRILVYFGFVKDVDPIMEILQVSVGLFLLLVFIWDIRSVTRWMNDFFEDFEDWIFGFEDCTITSRLMNIRWIFMKIVKIVIEIFSWKKPLERFASF